MSSRSKLAAVAIGLVIGWWSGHTVAQTEELDGLHRRILAMDRVDQTFEAIPLAKEYAAGIEGRSGTDNADYAIALDILVDLHVKLGRFGEAEPFARRSLAIRETLLSSDHLEVARSLNSLALVLESQSKYEEAEHLVGRSLAIREKALGPNNVQSAESANNLGVLLFRQGRNSQAEPYFRRALAVLETAREKNEGRIAGALSGLASVLEAEQGSAESEPLYRRALAIAEPLLQQERALREKWKNDPTAPMPPSTLGSSNYFFSGGRDWASVLAGMRWRTAGHAANFRAISLERGDRLMGNLHIARIEYRALIQAAYRMGARERAFQEEGFASAQWVSMNEAARAISQLQARFGSGTGELADLVRQRQDLLGRRRAADAQLTDMLMGRAVDVGEVGKNALRQSIASLDQSLDAIEARLGSDFPEYAALAHPEPLSIATTQDLLGPDEVLVQFIEARKWLKDDRTPPEEAFAWFISKSEVRWVKIPFGPEALAEKVRVLRCGLDASAWEVDGSRCSELWPEWRSETNRKRRSWLPFDTQRAHELYRILFADAEDLIRSKHLLVVPSPSLSVLPFHVLVAAQPTAAIPADVGAYRNVAWLANRNPISVLPSVASLKALRQFAKTSHATNPFIGFGNPLLKGIDGNDLRAWARQTCPEAPGRLAASITASTINRSAHTFFRGGLADVAALRNQPPLPETADELCAVAQLTGAQPTAVYLGEQATERTVKDLSAGGRLATYRVIHFATHGLLAGETERFAQSKAEPALLLSPPEMATDEDDGLLTASEVAQLHLDSDWVVLSACNTAAGSIGEEHYVEALSGLARAFFYAGARALLVSHWYVDSNATVHIITNTFAAMTASRTVGRAEALRRSMATLIATGGLNAHPMHWAPFVVVGEGSASMPPADAQKASAPQSHSGGHVSKTANPRTRATKMLARRSKAIDWRSEIWGR